MPFRLIQRKRQEFVHTRNWVNQHTSQSALKNSGIPFIAHIGKNYDDMADQKDLRLLLFGLQQIHEKHWLRKLAHGRELYLIPTTIYRGRRPWCLRRNYALHHTWFQAQSQSCSLVGFYLTSHNLFSKEFFLTDCV